MEGAGLGMVWAKVVTFYLKEMARGINGNLRPALSRPVRH